MELTAISAIDAVDSAQWNALIGSSNPFLRHEFLSALERHGVVSADNGWVAQHLALWDGDTLVAAAPAYLKGNSWGEFVFDFAWAHAYERNGLNYYPKLVIAVPYSPVTGPRMLYHGDYPIAELQQTLADGACQLARNQDLSSVHWLFTDAQTTQALQANGYSLRSGCQYHWRNAGYADFEEFLAGMSSKKRKNIRRERRLVSDQGIHLSTLHGHETTEALWQQLHAFYEKTFYEHGNLPVITQACFAELAETLGDRLVVFLAQANDTPVAAAICLRSDDTLYGRYWGCARDYDGLHFEACYYQGIEYCIANGIDRYEPGAQGEHKVARGFLPVLTHSAHHLEDERFQSAVDDFLARERPAIAQWANDLTQQGPYRAEVLEHLPRD